MISLRKIPSAMTRTISSGCFLFCATALLSCLDPSDERAKRDETIGQAAAGGVTVSVAGGHGAVRGLAPGVVHVWGGAPVLDIALDGGNTPPATWQIRLENLLPDAVVTAVDDNGAPLAVGVTSAPVPTEQVLVVDAPSARGIRLHVAPPDEASSDPFRIIVFGDVQEAIDDVQDIYQRMNADPGARFVVMVGDLTEQGSDEELARFQREMKTLRLPIFTTLGNHELGTDDGEPYSRFFGRGSDSFVFHGARITQLDSASATLDPKVYDWLDGWLAAGRGSVHIVTMHVPPQDPIGTRAGAFASTAEANRLLNKLGRAQVTATFYGHIHSYYAYENAGIPAIITGGGGAIPERMDTIGRHFMGVDIDPGRRTVEPTLIAVDHE